MNDNDFAMFRSYLNEGIPLIVNLKESDYTTESLESVLKIPFVSVDVLAYTEKELIPALRNKAEIKKPGNLDQSLAHNGIFLSSFRSIQCRKFTVEFLVSLLLQEGFSFIGFSNGHSYDLPPHLPALYIDQWKGEDMV